MKIKSPWMRPQMFLLYFCLALVLCSPIAAASTSQAAWKRSDVTIGVTSIDIVTHGVHWIGDRVVEGIAALISWYERD